jgi:hypothetical protein
MNVATMRAARSSPINAGRYVSATCDRSPRELGVNRIGSAGPVGENRK